MKSKNWIFAILLLLSSGVHAHGSKNISCNTRLLITDQSEQEFLGQTLELKVVHESLSKQFSRKAVIKRFAPNEERRLGDLFSEDELRDAELILVQSSGVYDGSCHVTLRRVRVVEAVAVGEQQLLIDLSAQDCARGVTYDFTSSLEKNLPVCDTQIKSQ